MTFYEMIGQYYDELFPPSLAQKNFLGRLIKVPSRVLDLGCATGGYASHLAEIGHQVEAIDLDPGMIDQLKKKYAGLKTLTAEVGDIKTLAQRQGDYDLIYCIGNTLVHLAHKGEVSDFVKAAYDQLKPGGRLVIQSVNYDRVLKYQLQSLPTIERPGAGLVFERAYQHVASGIQFLGRLHVGDEQYEAETHLLPILKDDLKKAFICAGFSEMGFYGDFEESPFTAESPALVTLTVK